MYYVVLRDSAKETFHTQFNIQWEMNIEHKNTSGFVSVSGLVHEALKSTVEM